MVSNYRREGSDKDNNGRKYPANSVDVLFALLVTRLVQF